MTHPRQTPFPTLHQVKARLAALVLLALPATVASAQNNDPYAAGTRALNQQRWPDAVAAFSRVADSRGKKADAALYWKAYSLNKLGNTALANATCAQLHTSYSTSTWNRDCSALALQLELGQNGMVSSAELQKLVAETKNIQVSTPELGIDTPHRDQTDPDADLKILALNSLMNRDPAQALPILRNLLTGNQSEAIRQHALFVLGQNNSPEAQQLMREIILGRTDPALQREAIQMFGITQGKRNDDILEEVYRKSSDQQVKQAVLSAFFISGDAPRLVRLAREEKNLDRKRAIVSQLALMQDKAATDYMLELLK